MSEPGGARFYRRPPGAGWLAALVAVPLALALIGSGGGNQSDESLALPEISTQATLARTDGARAGVLMAPLSLQHSGDDVVLSGQVPDELSRTFALDRTRTLLPGSDVVDLLTVIGGITAVDLAGLDPVLNAAAALPDFGFSIEGADIVLTGTAPSEAIATGVNNAVQSAWPELAVVDDIAVITPGFAPPTPGPAGECADLQQNISGLLRTPIQFDAGGSRVSDTSAPLLAELAGELRACPDASVLVTGHSADTGSDSADLSESARRAKAVADALISRGVRPRLVTARGVGAAEPVASDTSESGRQQNRRIEITVS